MQCNAILAERTIAARISLVNGLINNYTVLYGKSLKADQKKQLP